MKINEFLIEAPIRSTDDPNDPMIYGHDKANPMTLKGRIVQARNQLRELADMAESDELVVWEKITRLAKGGVFMGLEQNLEQIRHGIEELAIKRRKGGLGSRGINRDIGEEATDQIDEGIGQTIALFAVVGGLLFGGASYVAYQDQQLMNDWLTVYQKIKYKDPVQAKKIKELIDQYDSSGFVHGSSKRMTKTEIEQIIDNTRSKWENVEK